MEKRKLISINIHIWRQIGEIVRQGWVLGGFESWKFSFEIQMWLPQAFDWHFPDISVRLSVSGTEDKRGKNAWVDSNIENTKFCSEAEIVE